MLNIKNGKIEIVKILHILDLGKKNSTNQKGNTPIFSHK